MKFIHISDTHLIGDEYHSLYGIDPRFRLKKALQSINKWHKDAEFIVITGDLSNDGSKSSYSRLEEILKNSTLPVFPILGNHDIRDNFRQFFPQYTSDNFIQYSEKIGDKVFLFLDSVVENNQYGELCKERMAWLENQLKTHKKESIYIFMHHHPISCGLYEMDNVGNFKTQDIFWNLLKNYNNIKHISFGHIHRIMHSCKSGISLHSSRSTAFQVAFRTDCKEEYLTNEENPTYAIIDINKDGNTRVHHHEFMNEDRVYLGEC